MKGQKKKIWIPKPSQNDTKPEIKPEIKNQEQKNDQNKEQKKKKKYVEKYAEKIPVELQSAPHKSYVQKPKKQPESNTTIQTKENKRQSNRINTQKKYSQNQEGQNNFKKQQSRLKKSDTNFIQTNKSSLLPQVCDELEIRRIKKLFFENANKNVKDARVKYSKTHPCLFIQYLDGNIQKTILMRELIRNNKKFLNLKNTLCKLYSYLYQPVPLKYKRILIFGVQKAKDKHIFFSIKSLQSQKQLMFYYKKNQHINFTLFDSSLNSIEFNQLFIQTKKKQFPKDFQIFLEFLKESEKRQNMMDDDDYTVRDIFEIQQRESDRQQQQQQVIRYEVSTDAVENRLYTILEKDLTKIKEEIQQKTEQFYEITQNNQKSKYQKEKLGDKLEQLEVTLENFQNAKENVKKRLQLSRNKPDYHKVVLLCLKKMILAQKQMESRLPILIRRTQIFQLLKKKNLIILQGETGSGKSTQLPQLLCQFYNIFDNNNAKPVLVTQPRRLATRSLAERVAQEMEEKVRGFVDYAASADKEVNPNAKIIFKLDRLVLDELTIDPLLSKYSCMVIDQAHERTTSIDVILGLVKQLLTQRKDFKIIVTSASMDTQLFAKYFDNTKILKISGRLYPVDIIYKNYGEDTVGKISRVLRQEVLNQNLTIKDKYHGHILVFCSGVEQITFLVDKFKKMLNDKLFKIFALHGQVLPQQQRQVFAETNHIKLIFGNRIAETSITIDGVRVVIDPGEDIELIYDQKNKISTRKLQKISQSSAKQRAGRAGRTRSGYCFRLYKESQFYQLRPNKVPEIQNMALDSLVLRLKSLDIDDVITFPYISKPNIQGLKGSLQTMKMIGCLSEEEKITIIGKLIVKIPIEPFLARAIVESMVFEYIQKDECFIKNQIKKQMLKDKNILKSVIQILCMVIHSSNIFYVKTDDRQQCQRIKFQQFKNPDGDFLFFRNIYQKFIQSYRRREKNLSRWARQHYLNLKTLHQVRQLEEEVIKIVYKFKLNFQQLGSEIILNSKSKMRRCQNQDSLIIFCLMTSFCPNLCLFSGHPDLGYTLISQRRPINIYGTSNLSLQGINPKWILCYDLITNKDGKHFCKVAHSVDFQMLRISVDNYVYQKFQLEKLSKINLFYERCEMKNLPTLLIKQVDLDYRKEDERNAYPFLKQINLFINNDLNKLDFFYLKGQKVKSNISLENLKNKSFKQQQNEIQMEKVISQYLEKKKKKFSQGYYRHNYIGNIIITMKDGCQIGDIQFVNTENEYTLTVNSTAFNIIQNQCCSLGRIQRYHEQKNQNKIKMKIYIDDEQNARIFQNIIKMIKEYYSFDFVLKKEIIDKRKKTPMAKIFLRFFAGISKKNHIFANYEDDNNATRVIQAIENIITQQRILKRNNSSRCKLSNCHMKLTKNKKGINFYPRQDDLDELDLYQQLFKLKQNGQQYNFVLPKSIKKFRQPQRPFCTYTNDQWINLIQQLMEKVKIEDKNTSINVWGYYNIPRDQIQPNKPIPEFIKSFRVDMHAEIKTLKLANLQKLIDKYDGKKKVLGCEKLHLKFQFEQTISMPSQRVFTALQQQYQYQREMLKVKYPLVTFDSFPIRNRFGTKICIRIRSSVRQNLLEPTRIIANIFSPKFLQLNDSQYKFLDKCNLGSDIMSRIEQDYHYRVYFGFEKYKARLKVYADDLILKQVQNQLLTQIKKYQFFQEIISYKGKDLNKVKKILDQKVTKIKKAKNNNSVLQYEIIFQKRQIAITADICTQQEVKNLINQIVFCDKPSCDICSSIIQKPYRLFNCEHQYCLQCLSDYLREFKVSTKKQPIYCPSGCQKLINIYDIKNILIDQEFQKICDLKTSSYISQHTDKFYICKSPNCQQFFQKKPVGFQEKQCLQCDLCGKWFCLKCQKSHKNYTCQEWRKQDKLQQEDLKKFQIKKCPKCKFGIQKNEGCQHVTCTNCKTHICWKCLRFFDTAKQCYDHLAKDCGGIMI